MPFITSISKRFLRALFILSQFFLLNNAVFSQNPVASFSSSVTAGCAPLSVQFSNNSVNAASWFWDFGDGNTSVLANPGNIYLAAGNYAVKLVAYNGSLSDSLVINNYITVLPQPVSNFTATPASACLDGNFIQFINQSQNFDSCIWDFGDGTISNLTNPSHTYSQSATYSISLVAYNKSYGCSHSHTKSLYITIHPKPAATISVNTDSTCNANQVFSFSCSSPGATQWLWQFGDGSTSSLQNPSHVYSSGGSYTVTLITTSANGCKDTAAVPAMVTILSNPVPPINIAVTQGCSPLGIYFSTTNGIPGVNYLWNFGDGNTVQQSFYMAYNLYDSAGTFPVTLTATYANGCSNTNTYNSITVFSSPFALYSATNFYGCSPLTTQFNNLSTNSTSWLWDFGDGTTSTLQNPSHTFYGDKSLSVKLTAYNGSGCTDDFVHYPGLVHSPTINVSADVTSGCPPLTVNFSDFSVNGVTWLWNFGDGTTSNQQHPTHVYNMAGNYIVSVIVADQYGCSDTLILPSAINAGMQTTNTANPSPLTGCAPVTINVSDGSSSSTSWLWNFGDGTTSTLQNATHTYTQPGTYIISLNTNSSQGGCNQDIPNFQTVIVGGGSVNFTYDQTECPPYVATFYDSSANAVSWFWDFGDGTTSTVQNPTHLFANPGSYNVSLTVTTADGCVMTSTHNLGPTFTPLIANPTALVTDTTLPMTVQFFANSIGATGWLWTFGDSSSSTLENPVHIYTQPGPYTITLTLFNDSCQKTYTYPGTSLGMGSSSFGGYQDSIHYAEAQSGCAPMIVSFHNPFVNTVAWFWDFGDGTTSNLSDPVHTYSSPGVYDLLLIAQYSNGNADTLFSPAWATVSGVTADFSINPVNLCNGIQADFASNTSNAISYLWDFGDGTTSNASNPSHLYTNVTMNYVVSLLVTDSSGCTDYLAKIFYAVSENPVWADMTRLCAPDTINFHIGNMNWSSYVWDFGDGNSSTLSNPSHVYSDTGTYSVTLTVTDLNGCTKTFTLPALIQSFKPVADFSITTTSNCVWVKADFKNLSQNSDQWIWNFGNGATSSLQNPSVYYNTTGYYTVTLTASKNICSDTKTLPNAVYVPNRSVNFSYVQNNECLPISVTYSDSSVDAVQWKWDFGDGTTSNMQNPVHIFNTAPTTDVKLTITDVNGCSVSLSKPNITVLQAGFSAPPLTGCSPLQISFTDTSLNAVSWFWDFGDGNTSTQQNPVHSYSGNGVFGVTLVVTAVSGCTDTVHIDSIASVAYTLADFISNYVTACAPSVVDFTDMSIGATSWFWDFGDGTTSTLQNPSHVYALPGNYPVTLITTAQGICIDTMTKPSFVEVLGPVSQFGVSAISGCTPFTVQFIDSSLNATTWSWNFGNGSTSNQQNPSYTYINPGSYTVSLITSDTNGCESIFTFPVDLAANQTPFASFTVSDTAGCTPFSVSFIDSALYYDNLLWIFGDGSTSNSNNPVYTYTIPGQYYVTLIASTIAGCADTASFGYPVDVVATPVADFTTNTPSGCAPHSVSFINTSLNTSPGTTVYQWDFGDGTTSLLQNPVHVYLLPGSYTVSLIVVNSDICSDTMVKNNFINVYDTLPPPPSPIYSASVRSDTEVEITWLNSSVPDLATYILYRLDNLTGIFQPIYSMQDTGNSNPGGITVYVDMNLNTLQNTYTYKIQVIDLCGYSVDTSQLQPHTTINLSAYAQGYSNRLNWTPYGGCAVSSYEIYRQEPYSAAFSLLNSVSGNTLAYLDTGILCPEKYNYRILALDLCGNSYTAWSDTASARPLSIIQNQEVEVVRSTVVNDSYVLTEWTQPVLAPDMVKQFDIYRAEDSTGTYQQIASVPGYVTQYSDFATAVHHRSYYYRIKIINWCKVTAIDSNLGNSILLTGDAIDDIARLFWKPYIGWDTGVEKYIIERLSNSGTWQQIKTVDGNTLEYEDK